MGSEMKKSIKHKLCNMFLVGSIIIMFTIGANAVLSDYKMEYFFISLAGAILIFFMMLFVSVIYCPEFGGSSNNKRGNSSGSFSDGSE